MTKERLKRFSRGNCMCVQMMMMVKFMGSEELSHKKEQSFDLLIQNMIYRKQKVDLFEDRSGVWTSIFNSFNLITWFIHIFM